MALPTTITVKGKYLKLDGTPESGTVQFFSKVYVLHSEDETAVVPSEVKVTLDNTGSFEVDLPATNDPNWTPVGWTYRIILRFSGDYSIFQAAIPYNSPGGIIWMSDLVPAQPGGSSLYASFSHTHQGFVTEETVDQVVADAIEETVGPTIDAAVDAAVDAAIADLGDQFAPTVHTHAAADIVSGTIALARLPVGVGSSQVAAGDHTHNYDAVYAVLSHNHNSAYSALGHTHAYADITGTPTLNKAAVGLGNVDNTSDADKPVSTATQTVLDLKLDEANPVISDSTFTVKKADDSSGIRMRSTGGAVDFDKMNGDVVVSSFAGPGFTGTQTGLQRWRATGNTFAGLTEFGDSVYGGQQAIDGTNGIAKLGAKNSLTNVVLSGRKATAGSPSTGTWATDDVVLASDGWWLCTAGGSPGTWTFLGTAPGAPEAHAASHEDGGTDELTLAQSQVTSLVSDLAAKAPTASPTFTGTVSGITKSMVGLANVDNTTDANKPVSTATQTALDLKAPLASPTFTGTVAGITKSMVGLGNVDNTSDANKPISTATQTALDAKADDSEITALDSRLDAVEAMTPVIMKWNGSAYVEATDALVFVGPSDPGSVPDGSVWIDTTP